MPLDDAARADLKNGMDYAAASYPASWMSRLNEQGEYRLKASERGYYNHSKKVIAFSGVTGGDPDAGKFGEVAVHELGHGMEKVIPGLLAAENAFMWSRASKGKIGKRKQEKLEEIYKNSGEIGYRDEFSSLYSGKDYGGAAFEVFTTGVQELLGGGSGYLDEDFTNWTLGALALL